MFGNFRWLGLIWLTAGPFVATSAEPLANHPAGVIYQIYVESFQDEQGRDGSGDFAGIRARLPYLHELGVGAILLMPIFESSGGMGYIPYDYYRIRSDYAGGGSPSQREREFRRLTREAKRLGIRVLLDVPINHIGRPSEWFEKSRRRVAGFEDYFRWVDSPLAGWRRPWDSPNEPSQVFYEDPVRKEFYYSLFSPDMPDLNHESPAVQNEIDRVFDYWSSRGVDGFRIDAAKHLVEGVTNRDPVEPANLAVLEGYLKRLRVRHPNASFYLEAWSRDPSQYEPYLPNSGDVVFDFSYLENFRDSLVHSHPWAVRNALGHLQAKQNEIAPSNRVVFSGNHDVARIRSLLGDDRERVELAHALTFMLPWTPLIYYGEELFMPGRYLRGSVEHPENIVEVGTPMAWTPAPNAGFTDESVDLGDSWNKRLHADFREHNVASELGEPASMLNWVRELIAARQSLPFDDSTRIEVEVSQPESSVLRYTLTFSNGDCVAAFLNFSLAPSTAIDLSTNASCPTRPDHALVERRSQITAHRDSTKPSTLHLGPRGIWFGAARRLESQGLLEVRK